ncbi:hypothetical protein [Actinomadura nitritigenes]|uniref:hypothetical protein n=1 Tax=Actinomadura nitritigenes TaxID=134602 RepID=UPI003D8EDB3F
MTLFFPVEPLGVADVDAVWEAEVAGLDIGETAAEGEGSALQALNVSRPLAAKATSVKCRMSPSVGTGSC